MYEPRRSERLGCRDVAVLVQATFAVIIPIFAAMIAIFLALVASLYLLLTHPIFTLVPFAALAVGVWLFYRWERWRYRPPDDQR